MDYSKKKNSELKEICSKLGIKGFSKKNKKQLIEMISNSEPKSDLKTKQLKKKSKSEEYLYFKENFFLLTISVLTIAD